MIKVFGSAKELCFHAMEIFIELAQKNIAKKGRFVVALSGGNTPNMMYDLLAQKENAQKVNWNNVFVFWGDERYVPYRDPNNNAYQAYQHLLDKVNIPARNIFRIPVSGEAHRDARQYEQNIIEFFQGKPTSFDLIFLGIGDEGHTASIFPGSALLHEQYDLVKEVYVEMKQSLRISFTPNLINAAREVIFMAAGKTKATALKKIIEGAYHPEIFPAQIVNPVQGHVTWLLDSDAAAQLTRQKKA